jgi:hypothetical protein
MSLLLAVLLAVASGLALADCKTRLPVEGVVSLPGCDPSREACLPAHEAVYAYQGRGARDDDAVSINAHASPWRIYDGDYRILTIEEVAALLRPALTKGAKRVILNTSWSAVRPEPNVPSLAERLSRTLKGVSVRGADGFLWVSADGTRRTTRQAMTIRQSGPYWIAKGAEVMVSAVAGWPLDRVDQYIAKRDGPLVMRAGAAADIFSMCPDRALELFEIAAQMGEPIAAYNAALMHLDNGSADRTRAAKALLSQATKSGDQKAAERLRALESSQRPQ